MDRAACALRERQSRLTFRPRRSAGPASSASFSHFLPRAVARLALAALLFAVAASVAAPASAAVLVSNIGQTAGNDNGLNSTFNRAATAFTTGGSNASRYKLESVELVLDDLDANDTFTVTIRTVSSNNPGSVHATLTNPTLADGTNTFSAPSGTTLTGSTTYFVHVERTAGTFKWGTTLGDNEDSGGATGWSIANQGVSKAGHNAWTGLSDRSHRFRVNGSIPPTVSSAAVSGTSLTIIFNQDLAAASGLANGAFTVKKSVSGSEQTETLTGSPAISGNKVTLTLASAVVSTDTDVKVSYMKPSTGSNNKLKNTDDIEVESFTDQSVSNKAAEAPDLEQVSVTSTPRSGTTPKKYGAGEKIQVTVTFDEAVTVTGDPVINVEVGTNSRPAAYASGSGSTDLVFEHTVVSGDSDSDGISINANALTLDADSGSEDYIRDGDSNDADITHAALGTLSAHQVDGSLTPPTNTAPTASDSTVATDEDAAYTFSASDFNFADTDMGDTLASVKITEVESAGDLELDGSDVSANAVVTKAQLDNDELVFTPDANANGSPYATFKFKVNDGTDDSAAAYTMTIDVTAVNDLPSGKPRITGGSTVGTLLTAGAGTIADADGLPSTTFPSGYTFQWVRQDDSSGTSAADISSATGETYMLAAADLGKHISVKVDFTDDGGTAESIESDTVGPVGANTLPVASDKTVETNEDEAYTFAVLDFNFNDLDFSAFLEKVKIVTVETAGDLELDGTAVSANQEITVSDIDADKLVFTPAANANGASYATFTFKVNDGTDESASSYTMTIDVDPVPDVTQVAVTSTPKSGTTPKKYGAGEKIQVTATFDEAVTVTDDPLVELVVGSNTKDAGYASGSGTTELVFEYTVVSGDTDSDGIEVNADVKLDADSGSEDYIRDGDGNDADVSFTALAAQSGHPVDGSLSDTTAPTVSSAAVDTFTLVITFNENLADAANLANDAFAVTVADPFGEFGDVSVILDRSTAPSISGDTVTLTLQNEVARSDTDVKVSYTKPNTGSDNKLKDAAGNEVASFTDQAVTNNTPNTPPRAANKTVTTNEGTALIIATSNFAYSDFDLDTLASVRITELPASGKGSLTLDGTDVTLNQVISKADLDARRLASRLVFTPPANGHGAGFAAFQFKVNDGYDDSLDAYTMTINVTAASDALPANEYFITGVPYWTHEGSACTTVSGEAPGLIPAASNPNNYRCRIEADEEGGAETFRVRMKNPVTRAVTVSLSPRDGGALSVTPAAITFRPDNWYREQEVSVSGLADADGLDEWDFVYLRGETGARPDSVRVRVVDDDTHTQSGHSLIYSEHCNCLRVAQGGAGQTFTVRLRFQPEGTVTLNWNPLVHGPVKPADNGNAIKVFKDRVKGTTTIPATGGVKISPKYMTFTRENWQTPQAFTVTADMGTAGTIIPLRPWWERSQYPYTSSPEFAIEVVTSLGTTLPDPPALGAAMGDGAVRLTWTTPEDGEAITGWQARYGEATRNGEVDWGEWYTIPGAEPDAVAHTVTGLTNGTPFGYGFQVRAVVGALKTSPSNTALAMPMAGMTLDAPGRPELSVESGNGAATLSWNAIRYGGTITGWQYRYGVLAAAPADTVDWGDWTDMEDAGAQTRSHTLGGLENDTEYGVQLRAMAGENAGDMSERQVAWPFHPTFDAVEFTAVTSTTLTMEWVLPQGVEATALRAMHRLVEGEWAAAQLALDATSHIFTGLTPETRYNFRIELDSATGGTSSGILVQDTRASDPLDTRMEGSLPQRSRAPESPVKGSLPERSRAPESPAQGACAVEVSVEFLDAEGNAVAVASLAASDFTVTNGRAGTPVAAEDGLSWTLPVQAATDARGLIRVRLAQTTRWSAAEQVFYNHGAGFCAPAGRAQLADLQIDDIGIDPLFSAATTSYTARTADADAEVHASAVYTDAAVSIAPADADPAADGHQLALAEGETEVTITVTPGDGSAAKTYSVTVTREAGTETGALTGFVLVDASSDADLGAVEDGDTVTVTESGGYGIRVEADPEKQVGSVVLRLAGPGAQSTHTQTENIVPYSLFGDAQGAEHGRVLSAGSYTLTATEYAQKHGAGTQVGSLAVTFTVEVGAASPPSAGVLSGFTLLDASDQSTVTALADGSQVDLGDNAGGSFAIRADLVQDATAGSVALSLSGAKTVTATENIAPYSLWGDDMQGALYGNTLPAGTYTLTATAHAGRQASGSVLGALSLSFEVLSPPTLSVADAQVQEGPGATLDFAVTLSRSSSGTVTVAYATADGTATAGLDYTAASGTLTFSPGEREKTVSIAVLEDDIDDNGETLTLRLSEPSGATIEDGEATGTISNTDAIPAAWLIRFGRTVTGQVLQAVEDRMAAPRQEGSQLTLAGQALPSWRSQDTKADGPGSGGHGASETAAFEAGAPQDAMGLEIRALTPREFWTGTSFNLTSKAGEGHAALWGRASVARFDGREGALALDGEVTTGLVGADWATQERIAGLAIGLSSGSGSWRRDVDCQDNCGGTIEADLTGLYPYMGIDLSERVTLWAAAGYADGEVTVRQPEKQAGLTADLTMTMGAAGLRGELLRPEDGQGLSVAVKGDARLTRTSSDPVNGTGSGNLSASDADAWLVRMGIEGSRRFELGAWNNGASLTPSFEIALRLDGGDAETGLGADLGGGLAFSDPDNGVAMDMRARVLIAHESPGFREWGASFAASWDPRPESERGFALSLRHSWGAAPAGGMDALLTRETMAGLAGHDDSRFEASRRLEIEVGYGLPAFNGRYTGTPNAGFGMSPGTRDWRIGWRLTPAAGGSEFEASLDATRRESDHDSPEHGVTLWTAIRW